jgi:hypothetical protein
MDSKWNWFSVIAIIILLAGTITNGVLYFQQTGELDKAQNRLSLLEYEV